MSLILYPPNERAFDTNGIGILAEAIDDEVYQSINGQYELKLKYPVDGLHFTDIVLDAYITATPDPVTAPQPFQIYRISKPMRGLVTVYAWHAAYLMQKIPVAPFSAATAQEALAGLKNNAVIECPFDFWTDKTTVATMRVSKPAAIWSLLGNSKGSILDTYGGEYEFDKWTVKLHDHRGADRGVVIRYGKNLTDLQQDENISNMYTGVYPFWRDFEGNVVELPERYVKGPGTYAEEKIKTVDFSTDFQDKPTEDQLRKRAEQYISDNNIGKPLISWTVYFVKLEQTEEYRGKAFLEQILLGDTVTVVFPRLGVDVSARAVACRFRPSTGQFLEVTLGKVKSNIADTIASHSSQIAQNNFHAGFIGLTQAQIFEKLTDGGKIQGIYSYDNRWYINAEYAKIVNMHGESITAGKLSSVDGKSYFDLTAGKIVTNNITATGGTIGGCSIVNGKLQIPAAHITGTLTAAQVDADNLKVKAANIDGEVVAGKIVVKNSGGSTLLSAGDGAVTIAGWRADSNSLYSGSSFAASDVFLCTGSAGAMSIGGSDIISGWVFKAGNHFGVTKSGALYASDGHFKGKITATSGSIGNWSISTDGALAGSGGPHGIKLHPRGFAYNGKTFYVVIYDSGGAVPIGGITANGWEKV